MRAAESVSDKSSKVFALKILRKTEGTNLPVGSLKFPPAS